MVKIGYLLICEDVAYSEEENIHYVKNPLDVVMLDETPSSHSFYMLSSLFDVDIEIEYLIEVQIFTPKEKMANSFDMPIVFSSDPPKGKSSLGIITLKIHHKNFEFSDEGIYTLTFKISEKEAGGFSFKEIEFPVIIKPNEGDEK